MERIKLFLLEHRRWVYLMQYMIASTLLIVFVYLIDYSMVFDLSVLPVFATTSVSLAKTILGTLAGALLTITTFTFSTIISVLSLHASNYSSRIIENFVNKPITMKVLGVYLGGFMYSIVSLSLMRDTFSHEQVIAGTIGIVYSVVCIIFFIRFVNQVVDSFQDVNIISDIYDETLPIVEEEMTKRHHTKKRKKDTQRQQVEVHTMENGYLAAIDTEQLNDLLCDVSGYMEIRQRIGDFMISDALVAVIYLEEHMDSEELEERLNMEKIQSSFILQDNKVSQSDYRYGIIKLVEIAMRALSPGINDPNTAIHCIHKIALLLDKLSRQTSSAITLRSSDTFTIYYQSYSFKEDLYDFYSQILHYGKSDIMVVLALLQALRLVQRQATEENKRYIHEFVQYIRESVTPLYPLALDRDELNAVFEQIEHDDQN